MHVYALLYRSLFKSTSTDVFCPVTLLRRLTLQYLSLCLFSDGKRKILLMQMQTSFGESGNDMLIKYALDVFFLPYLPTYAYIYCT